MYIVHVTIRQFQYSYLKRQTYASNKSANICVTKSEYAQNYLVMNSSIWISLGLEIPTAKCMRNPRSQYSLVISGQIKTYNGLLNSICHKIDLFTFSSNADRVATMVSLCKYTANNALSRLLATKMVLRSNPWWGFPLYRESYVGGPSFRVFSPCRFEWRLSVQFRQSSTTSYLSLVAPL